MRMLMEVTIPNQPFNELVRKGTAGQTMQKLLEATKPQAAYFSDFNGRRGGILVVDLKDPSQIPSLAEPWFLALDAQCHFRIAMTPEELARSGIDQLGKGW